MDYGLTMSPRVGITSTGSRQLAQGFTRMLPVRSVGKHCYPEFLRKTKEVICKAI